MAVPFPPQKFFEIHHPQRERHKEILKGLFWTWNVTFQKSIIRHETSKRMLKRVWLKCFGPHWIYAFRWKCLSTWANSFRLFWQNEVIRLWWLSRVIHLKLWLWRHRSTSKKWLLNWPGGVWIPWGGKTSSPEWKHFPQDDKEFLPKGWIWIKKKMKKGGKRNTRTTGLFWWHLVKNQTSQTTVIHLNHLQFPYAGIKQEGKRGCRGWD